MKRIKAALIPFVAMACTAAMASQAPDKTCYALFKKAGAIPLTQGCPYDASAAEVGMGNYYCTAGTQYIDAYCGDICYRAVTDLDNSKNSTHAGVSVFVQEQHCIASAACLGKEGLEKPAWLDNVVPDFIEPFVDGRGRWPNVISSCDAQLQRAASSVITSWVKLVQLNCANEAATYHIKHDLLASLKKNGCGTQKDWQRIAEQILNCVKANPDLSGFALQAFIKMQVIAMRDSVRSQCLAPGGSAV